jgi:hypothetical protein
MFRLLGSRRIRVIVALAALLPLNVSLPAMAGRLDPGAGYERLLQLGSRQFFGFGKPVPQSASTPSNTEPGDKAVEVAQGLSVRLVSDKVGENADMIALWPDDKAPTHAIICNEIDGTVAGAAASIQRVRLSDGQVSDIAFGLVSCDPVRRTAWGTIVVGEEAGPIGRLWEIIDPLNVNGVVLTRTTASSSDPAHVVARTAVGQLSFEGIVLLPGGTMYYGDELRPSNGKPGGGLYKFVPATPRPANAGPINDLSQSPLASGNVYVLRLGLRSGATDYGHGTNTGAGKWIGPLTVVPTTTLASAALATGGYTGYYRPEDMELDSLAWAEGHVRACWTNTGNDAFSQWGEVLCITDDPTSEAGFNTGTMPVVSTFIVGNPSLRMPDNLAFQPMTGILYVLMDATTSAENPAFTNDDVWACLPDGADLDTLSDGCVRVMTLKDGTAEFTGIQFFGDGKSFLIHLQHRTQDGRAVPHTTDMIQVSSLQRPLAEDER